MNQYNFCSETDLFEVPLVADDAEKWNSWHFNSAKWETVSIFLYFFIVA